ncbi:homocysteine S-methyltransferase family protein [Pelagibius sp. CAU 1746]|uniref:homocysteine S-methyltransferase family protein n=1 Tax=Pelagibius sp. CAU 1746 TaxID=3140370 RepID=UPI00325A9A5B
MPYATLKKRLGSGDIVILDGATGTELQRRGVAMDPAAWCGVASLDNQKTLSEIHADYIAVGAEVITANTFATSRVVLAQAGYGDRVEEINRAAVEAALRAREVSGSPEVVVAASLSHMVYLASDREPDPMPSEEEAAEAFHEQAGILKAAGAELILLEMMYHPARVPEVLAAALATGLPVWFGLSARSGAGGRLLSYYDQAEVPLAEIMKLIPGSGIDAAGCMHSGAEISGAVLSQIRKRFKGPLLAYPDSGYFEMPEWHFHDVIAPARLEGFYLDWLENGAQIIGGCCGLTVEHVKAAVRARDRHQNAM